MQIYAPRVHRAFQSSVPDILSLSLSLSLALATAVRTFENLHPCLRLFVPICPHCCPQKCKGMIVKKGGGNRKLIKRCLEKKRRQKFMNYVLGCKKQRTRKVLGFFLFSIQRSKERKIDGSILLIVDRS